MSFPSRSAVALAVAFGLTPFTAAREAEACGGLFCSSSSPVNQAAERIVFAKNENDTVTAVIEILYEGPSEKFAWVLPVPPEEVTVAVSSRQALDALQQASNPSYNFQTSFAEGCDVLQSGSGPGAVSNADGSVTSPPGASPVQVVASGTVGPYDYTQLAVDPDDDDPAQAAIDWLEENEYDVGALGPDVLRPYLVQDMNLLAFRLTKGTDTGSIRPVMLTYPGERPLIPIRPTAVAANDDMGILVWVLGNGRAVPTSYLSLELNDARIDWFNPNPTYNDVIIQAADEAGGQGFVTEQAGPAGTFSESLFPSWKEEQFGQLRTGQFGSLQEFLQAAQSVAQSHFYPSFSGFGGPLGDGALTLGQNQYDGFLDLLSDPEIVPLREGATAAQLNACVGCYFQTDVAVRNDAYPSTPFDPENDPLLDMDVQAFLDEMERLVIEPLRTTRALFEEHSHVTRLYTTMSADDMTLDPEFDLNPELADVSNVHTAERIFECNGSAWTIKLPSGLELKGSDNTWPVPLDDEMPFNVRVMQLSTSGDGEVVLDNTDAVVSRLIDLGITDMLPGEVPVPSEGPSSQGGEGDDSPSSAKTDGGCAVHAPRGALARPAFWALLALGLAAVRRRSRSR